MLDMDIVNIYASSFVDNAVKKYRLSSLEAGEFGFGGAAVIANASVITHCQFLRNAGGGLLFNGPRGGSIWVSDTSPKIRQRVPTTGHPSAAT